MTDLHCKLRDVAEIRECVDSRLAELSCRPSDERVALAQEALQAAMRAVLALAQHMGRMEVRREE